MTPRHSRRQFASIASLLGLVGCEQTTARNRTAVLTVAAASNFRPTATRFGELLAPVLQGTSSSPPRWVFGASGTLARQLIAGLPADLFLAADVVTARGVADECPAAGSPIVFARGRLAWWPRPPRSPIETIAIANPRVAPYGRAAASVLSDHSQNPVVQTATVSDVTAAVGQGRATVGVVSGSIASSLSDGDDRAVVWISPTRHPPLPQSAVGMSRDIASAAATVLLSPAVQQYLQTVGYMGVGA